MAGVKLSEADRDLLIEINQRLDQIADELNITEQSKAQKIRKDRIKTARKEHYKRLDGGEV